MGTDGRQAYGTVEPDAGTAGDPLPEGAAIAAATLALALLAGFAWRHGARRARLYHELHASRTQARQPASPEPAFCSAGTEVEMPLSGGELWDSTTTRFCPVCCSEYLSGTMTCEDCGMELVDEEDVPPQGVEIQEGIVRVARVVSSVHGQLLREFLQSSRIPCCVARCSPWDVLGADIYVFESDALRAKKLIRHFLREMDVAA